MDKKKPLVSIIIPFFDADNHIRQCLDSVVNQLLTEIEIICINDNSQDKSLEIVKEYAKTDRRIKIIENGQRKGQSYSRNRGIEIATGEYIGFIDADDFVDEKMYKSMLNQAIKTNADIVMCKALLYDERTKATKNDEYYELKCFERFSKETFNHEDTKNFITDINVAVWNKLYRRKFLAETEIKFCEGSIFEDLPFFFEIYTKAQNVTLIDEFLYYYRINIQNTTMTKTNLHLTDRVDMFSLTYEILKNLLYFNEIKSKVTDWIINDIFYRFIIIDSCYQKEYFYKMQKFFRIIDISNVDIESSETPFFPYFCEIREKSYEENIKYWLNRDISRNKANKEKNNYNNRYIKNQKKKFENFIEKEIAKEQEYYQELIKKQLAIQKESYDKILSLKNRIEESSMTRPKVSIILPVYNVAPYLRQSLDSIIAQTLTDIEIICIDDGSTDESGKILDEYQAKDKRIKVLHKKNAGTGAARNDGLRMATGECIGFVDPDDWILPNMYERLYGILQEKNLDIVMFTPDVYNDKTKKHEGFLYFQDSNFPSFLDNKIFNKDDISPFSYPMCVWNKLYTKKLFDENNIDFAEGLDFEDHKCIFKTLFTAKRIYFIREKLYVYRHSREGSILSDNDTRMFDHIKIYDVVENVLKETGNWEKFRLDFLRYKVHNILYYYTMIKPQYKKDYYNKMVKSLQATKMNKEEIDLLARDYPELKNIMNDTPANKIKRVVNIIIKKEDIKD